MYYQTQFKLNILLYLKHFQTLLRRKPHVKIIFCEENYIHTKFMLLYWINHTENYGTEAKANYYKTLKTQRTNSLPSYMRTKYTKS